MKNPYAILRVMPLRSWSAVAAMSRHGRRQGDDMMHVDRQRSPLNRYGTDWETPPTDVRACIEAVAAHHGATRRKASPIASHLLLTASAEYFRPGNAEAMGTWDQARLDAWLGANLTWVKDRWPKQVAAWRLDLDETTPHLDVFLVPIHQWKTRAGKIVTQVSHRAAFGTSRRSFAKLQDDYAAAMQPLGLSRGRPRSVTGAVHVHPAELRRQMAVDATRRKAMEVGLSAILRRDIRGLGRGSDGGQSARFSSAVPTGQRQRLLELCKPAWPELVRFERELVRQAGRLASGLVRELVSHAEADRQDAARTLDDAHAVWRSIADKDRALRNRSWDDVVRELVR